MIRRYETEFRALLALADALMAMAAFIAVSMVRFGPNWRDAWAGTLDEPWLMVSSLALGWVALLGVQGLYSVRARWSARSEALGVVQAAVWLAILTFALLFLVRLPNVSRQFLLLLFPVLTAITVASRLFLRWGFQWIRRRGRNTRNVVIVGTGQPGRDFAESLESHGELALRVEGFVGDESPELASTRWHYLGPSEGLIDVLHERVVDEVAICLPMEQWQLVDPIAALCEEEGKIVRIPVRISSRAITSGRVEELDGTPVLSLVTGPDRVVALAAKRFLDIVGSVIGLVALSPVFLVGALAIWRTEGRPILFRQARAGLNGRPFEIVKFRTMGRDADARRADLREFNEVKGNASFKMTNDPRITPIGRLLRRTSIDELPQLWNVLKGEMSLVGPRPHPFDDVAGYDVWHRRRLSMKPGITGLWQIGARSDGDFDVWVSRDLEYIDRWSLWLDIRLLVMTIPALLRAEGR